MALVIRFARAGTKKKPVFHLVVADKESPRDGKWLARIGLYNPKAQEAKEKFSYDADAFANWVKKGAQPSQTVGQLVKAVSK